MYVVEIATNNLNKHTSLLNLYSKLVFSIKSLKL